MLNDKQKLALELWAKALESGKYKQGCGLLKQVAGDSIFGANLYCCMGVASEIMGLPNKLVKNAGHWPDGKAFAFSYEGLREPATSMPGAQWFQDTYGMSWWWMHKLSSANDVRKATFDELAAVVRKFAASDGKWAPHTAREMIAEAKLK